MVTPKRRINIYGWSERYDKALLVVYKKLLEQGIPVDHNGEPNVSAILLYLLEREAKRGK